MSASADTPTRQLDGAGMRARILLAIADFTACWGYPPTVRELARAVGSHSTGHVSYHLGVLDAAGMICRRPGSARTLRLTEQKQQS